MTNIELVSRIVSGLKAHTKDGAVRWRYLLSIARTKSRFFMSQKLDELTLNKEEGIKTEITCFPMKRIKGKDCGVVAFRLCDKIMQSCHELPETIYGKSGTGVLRVVNIDDSREYKYVTAKEYTRLKKRKYRNTEARYFTMKNNRLLLPDSENELVDITVIAVERADAQQLSECNSNSADDCHNAWEDDFICPDRFLDLVIQDTISEVANFYRTSVSDENGDLDEHQKTKTTN